MSKTIKTIFLLLAAAIFFAGCSNSSGGSSSTSSETPANTSTSDTPNIEVDTVTLSDGRWDMDFVTNQATNFNGQTHQNKTVQHVEANISGDNVEIIKATQQVDNGETQDITNDMKNRVSRLSDFTNSSNYLSNNSPSGQSFDPSILNANVKNYKNKDGTKYHVTVDATVNPNSPALIAMMQALGATGTLTVTINSVMDYVKK